MPPRYRILLADQALYAASNLAAVALAGRVADRTGFGRFMLAFLALSVVVNGARALWSEPELAAGRATTGPGRAGAGTAAALAAGLVLVGPPVAAGAGAVVATVLHDRLRYQSLLRGRPAGALRSDGLWLALVVAGGLYVTAGPGSVAAPLDVVRVWSLGAVAATLVNLPPAGPPARSSPVAGRRLFVWDFGLQAGATQLVGLVLGAVLAAPAYGELRSAITVLGPVGVANVALGTRLLGGVGGAGTGRRLVAGIVVAALAGVGLLLVVPPRWGSALLGSAWPGRSVLALIGATVAVQTVSTRWLVGLKRAGRRRALLAVRAGGAGALAPATVALALRWPRADVVAAGYLAVNGAVAVAAWRAARVAGEAVNPGSAPLRLSGSSPGGGGSR